MTLHDPRSDIGVKGDTSGLKLCCLISDLPMATMAGSLPKGSNTLAFSAILKCVRESWRGMKKGMTCFELLHNLQKMEEMI